MIGLLRGTINYRAVNWVILETSSGIGYKVYIDSSKLTDQSVLYTYHHIREDTSDLYGFLTLEDLSFFELLLTVSGIGPKMAQNLTTTLGREAITQAILANDPSLFRSVSGVGQRVAEKIIVELKNKISGLATSALPQSDVFDALLGLGYTQQEIMRVLKEVDPSLSVDQKIKHALRLLAH